jgi:hypothetical protein
MPRFTMAPAFMVAELVQGILHTTPRPAPRHANAATGVAGHLRVPFDRGRNSPGGWVILIGRCPGLSHCAPLGLALERYQ